MTQVEASGSYVAYPVERLADAGVGLWLVDMEKIVVDYGREKVYPGVVRQMDRAREMGVTPGIVTNCADEERLAVVGQQLGEITVVHQGLVNAQGEALRGKHHPDQFTHAMENIPQGSAGPNTAVSDDQLKSLRGARAAGIDHFIWTYPRGFPWRQHPGVLAFRFVEVPMGAALILSQRAQGQRPLSRAPASTAQ